MLNFSESCANENMTYKCSYCDTIIYIANYFCNVCGARLHGVRLLKRKIND